MVTQNQKSLQRRLHQFFARNSISRGEEYYMDGAVMAVQIGSNGASAEVIGSQIYTVSLDWTQILGGQISAYCTCPHFDGGSMCKHLWAFILHLDRAGVPPAQMSRRPLELNSGNRFVVSEKIELETVVQSDHTLTQRSSWRQAFHRPGRKKESSWREPPDIFLVLESHGREDSLQFKFFVAERGTNRVLGHLKQLALPLNGEIQHADAQLRDALKAIATLAMGEMTRQGRYSSYRFYSDPSTRTISLGSVRFILNDLLETGKIYSSKEDFVQSQLTGENLSLKFMRLGGLKLAVSELNNGHLLSGAIEIHSLTERKAIGIEDLKLFAGSSLFRLGNSIGFLDLPETDQEWFNELSSGALSIPPEDTEAFLETVINQKIKFELPTTLNWERLTISPTPTLELTFEKETARYSIDLKFQYGSRIISYWSAPSDLASLEDLRIYSRNQIAEERIFAQLPLHLLVGRRQDERLTVHAKNLLEFVKIALGAGIPVLIENKKVQEANDFQISVSSGVDWFDVDGQAEFSGRWVKFPSILEAIHRGESFVPLPDGSVGLLNEELTKRLEKLTEFAETREHSLRFGSAQGLILSSLLENETNLKLDAKFQALREKIQSFAGIKASSPVPSFKGKLRQYQREGLGWLEFLDAFGLGGILADDMGLGKTIQCLAFIEGRRRQRRQPSLLLAPKSVLENWNLEAKKFTPEMKILIHAGLERRSSKASFQKYDLVVTTYQTMLRDIELLKGVTWDCVIIDEAQAIKNPEALISRAAKLLPSQFRLAMTGTPIENSIQDLFSISDFVNPGFLNGKKRSAHLRLNDETREALSGAFKPVILRRTKEQVLKDLPEKTEQLVSVELESKQLKTYNELKRFYQGQLLKEVKEKGVNKSQIQILAALTRLRQAALHPALIDPSHAKIKSSKFEVVLRMLEEIISEGHRVLIFSQFTSLLALLKKELKLREIKFCYLDGQTTKRQQVVDNFKASACPVFLMSLKAGGVGLNLVEANYVFLLDPWWNPAVEAQAIDRVHRIGQSRAVNAYRFIAKNTVEEKILELQETKRGLSHEILGQKSSTIRNLTAEDIEHLFT